MGNNELQSYILNKDGKDLKDDYIEFLKLLFDKNTKEIESQTERKEWNIERGIHVGPYQDPDGNCFEFYKDLAAFLNEQEDVYKPEQEELYHYEPCEEKPFGIEVTDNKGELQFYLKSDQFGFSRPSTDQKHKYPYDIYLEKCKEEKIGKEDSVNKVCKWIYYSRTLGGSFLWPTDIHCKNRVGYNPDRGGTKDSKESHYIEDRVDLTLLEVFLYYRQEDYPEEWEKTILKRHVEKNKEIADRWFGHFGSFENYVDFFCFKGFVDTNNGYYIPKSIINGEPLNIDSRNNDRLMIGKKPPYENINRKVFNNVVDRIKERSKEMEDKVNGTEGK